jgi:PAS domain S-box-containing protein
VSERRSAPPQGGALLEKIQAERTIGTSREALRARLQSALASCLTEAEIVQVLYADLHSEFGYDAINLQLLGREGRMHNVAVDHGVLQDVRHSQLSESSFAGHYREGRSQVSYPESETRSLPGRGPGARRRPQTIIWIPISHRGQTIGSIAYQLDVRREVPEQEVGLLERIHAQLGVLVSNAYLNELTRNQAIRLTALNSIARALSGLQDVEGVARTLHATLAPQIPVDTLELVVREHDPGGHFRLLRLSRDRDILSLRLSSRSRKLEPLGTVLKSGRSFLKQGEESDSHPGSSAWVPVLERGQVNGVLSVHTSEAEAYEESTVAFLEQVSDEVSLALRNALSYAALEGQRRRLEVTNAVGRRLASSLDGWSIVRTLREELSRHLEFDIFSLATVEEGPAGPTAEAYVYDSGEERQLAPVPLAAAGPAREAYEKGRAVLIRRSRWARSFESAVPRDDGQRATDGALMYVTRSRKRGRIASRSIVWVPVRHGDRITALLSLQSYRAAAFGDWHVSLLEDVAAHVSLALATAEHFNVAQNERRRLEALHALEMGGAGAADERQVAEALFAAVVGPIDASYVALTYLDAQGQLTGYARAPSGQARPLAPRPVERTHYFKRLASEGVTLSEATPADLRVARPTPGWQVGGTRIPKQVLWVPLFQDDRVIGALSAQRHEDRPFSAREMELLKSAAPVVAIMLRSVRLHRANELALTHSVRIQEVAALAGHNLDQVVTSIAEQARNMLEAAGAACWAFDDDGRLTASAATGRPLASRVLSWSGRTAARSWKEPPAGVLSGVRGGVHWTLIPLRYADRLVGALASVRPPGGIDPLPQRPVDFDRHAAIAIENSRLVAETRGRIRTLEAVAGFASLDIARPERARSQMSRLVERALSGSSGMLWLMEGEEMVCKAAAADRRLRSDEVQRLIAGDGPRQPVLSVRRALHSVSADGIGTLVAPISVEGRVVGMLSADAGVSGAETRRLMTVLAGQAALVMGRLQLVTELNRQARMMRSILRHSPVGVVLEDADGRAIYANPEVERIYGIKAEAITGKPAGLLLQEAGATVLAQSEGEGGGPLELRLAERGTVVQVRRVPIPGSEEQPATALTLHEDITREHMVLEAKDLMLRAIGHEVVSPAAAMKTIIAGLLHWDQLAESKRGKELIEHAYEQSDRLLSLVENQLIIAKLETQHFEPRLVSVALDELLRLVVRDLRHRYGSRVDAVSIQLEAGLSNVLCDPTHLDQVLTNLIGNALEYTEGAPIRVSGRPLDGWLEVTVADAGTGLPPERRQALFQKSGPAGRNRSRGGLGLGLYLCRLVVERSFGGRIWLEDGAPTGTIFKFTVPAPQATRQGQAGAQPQGATLR